MTEQRPMAAGSRVNGHAVLRRRLTVLNVAFPFAPVSSDPVGGAEKVLADIDRALVAAGHRSLVIAPQSSRVAGELTGIDLPQGVITPELKARAEVEMRELVATTIRRERPDVVHLHGLDFYAYLPPPGVPVLVTLHSPLSWYPAAALRCERPLTFLHPVSRSQARLAGPGANLLAPIENGVAVPAVAAPRSKSCFSLALGRICAEKGFADGLAAARLARCPLLLAGAVFPYPEHEQYFRAEILPRLGDVRRWVGAVHGAEKRRLLERARCLLVPSKVPETCSLVALEAQAAGTPVIAYRVGALPDVVEHGVTGFLVESVAEMAAAIRAARDIDPEACRARARDLFPLDRMTRAYLRRYAEIAG